MTRPIKFRAWNLRDRTWHEVAWIRYDNGQDVSSVGVYWNDGQHNGATRLDAKDVVLMQSAGLTDKIDVETYEGDVVQYSYIPYDGDANKHAPVARTHLIEWSVQLSTGNYEDYEGGFAGFGLNPINITYPFSVIGNIYETPELLKAKR